MEQVPFVVMALGVTAVAILGIAIAGRAAERALRARRGEPQQARFVVDASAVIIDLRSARSRLRPGRET